MVPPSMPALFASRFQNRHGITAGDPVTVSAESPLPTARWSVMETCSAPYPRRGCAGSPTQVRGRARAQDPPRLHSASESAMEAYGCPYASMSLGICSVGAGCGRPPMVGTIHPRFFRRALLDFGALKRSGPCAKRRRPRKQPCAFFTKCGNTKHDALFRGISHKKARQKSGENAMGHHRRKQEAHTGTEPDGSRPVSFTAFPDLAQGPGAGCGGVTPAPGRSGR